MIHYTELENEVRKLRNNEEKVGKEILLQKYEKPYRRLIASINERIRQMAIEMQAAAVVLPRGGFEEVPPELKKKLIDAVQQIWNEEKAAGSFHRMQEAILQEYNLDKGLQIAFECYYIRTKYEAYAPIWVYYCRKIETEKEDKYQSMLTGMTWHETDKHGEGYWYKESPGGKRFSYELPPTIEQIAEAYKKDREIWGGQRCSR